MRGAWRLPALLVLLVVGAGGYPTPDDDLGPPLGVAWTHAMGGPAAGERTRPRVPCVDDGPVAGAPIGGMGAGTMGRTYRGDFARWHMRVGGHTHRPAAHTLLRVSFSPADPVRLRPQSSLAPLRGERKLTDIVLSVEAASTFGWAEWADASIGIDSFGVSAPGGVALEHLGISVEAVVEAARRLASVS